MSRSDTSPYVIILALWLLTFTISSQALIIAPIIPRIAEQLSTNEALLGTLITSYAVAVGVFAIIAGPISDYTGRRTILLAGTALMTVGLALHAIAWDFASLFGVRAVAGIAGGILNGAAVAYIGDYFPEEERGWANGWVFSGFAAGQIAGIPLGTILAERFGFRWPFLAFAIAMGLAFVLIWATLPRADIEHAETLSLRSALDSYAGLLHRTDVLAATVIFPVMFLGNSLYVTFLPTWLETTLGATSATIAGIFFVGGIASAIAGPQAGTLSDRIGRKPMIIGASLGIAVLMVLTPFIAVSISVMYALFFLVMGLFSARGTPFQALMTELVSGDERGSLINLTVGIGQIGNGLGGTVAAGVYASVGYPATTTLGAASMLVIAVLVWRYLPETISPDEPAVVEEARDSISSSLHRMVPDALSGPCHEAGYGTDGTGAQRTGRDGDAPDEDESVPTPDD